MAETVLHEKLMSSATPARSALACAAWIAPASLSEAIILGRDDTIVSQASVSKLSQNLESKFGQPINAKRRLLPGGILRANNAASIGIVPEPQNGSRRGETVSHWETITIAEARVSLRGAFAVASR